MKLSYHGELGQAYVELNDEDVLLLEKGQSISNETGYVNLGSESDLHWDEMNNAKLLGATISSELLSIFTSTAERNQHGGTAAIDRIGCALSIELVNTLS